MSDKIYAKYHLPGKEAAGTFLHPLIRTGFALIFIPAAFLFTGFFSDSIAQVSEDTTRTEREIQTPPPAGTYNNILRIPYHATFDETNINRYSLSGVDGRYTFHSRLRGATVGDFMMREEERYNPYGPEWVNGINMRLAAILQETFQEQNSFLRKLARIAPFLGFGFFEEYEVPIVPRQEYSNPEPQLPDN